MWKIGVFLIVISTISIVSEAKALGYCTGIGLHCVPVMTGHLLGLMAITTMEWGDGTNMEWGDGTNMEWSGN